MKFYAVKLKPLHEDPHQQCQSYALLWEKDGSFNWQCTSSATLLAVDYNLKLKFPALQASLSYTPPINVLSERNTESENIYHYNVSALEALEREQFEKSLAKFSSRPHLAS